MPPASSRACSRNRPMSSGSSGWRGSTRVSLGSDPRAGVREATYSGHAPGGCRRYVGAMTEPQNDAPVGSPEKDPADWTTGDEPMTGPQKSYLETLSQQAGRPAPGDDLSKADASRLIDELQAETGRGQ